jgi:4a-hydroxytetrahydrobiopterin dehydratase
MIRKGEVIAGAEPTTLKCKPCEGGTLPMPREDAERLLVKVEGWHLQDNTLQRAFKFRDFQGSMRFVNRVAELAETEGHHPNISNSWNRVTLTLTSHAIHGLSQNDFILAAKINRIKLR